MSSFSVNSKQVTILPHPNADVLELAQIDGYRAVVKKGEYNTGDYIVYIPEAALVPEDLLEELGLTGRLAGSNKNRVKAIRLRGELSQGIVCKPSKLSNVNLEEAAKNNVDFAQELGITKYIPYIPAHMGGTMISAPDLIKWIDIENIKKFPTAFEPGEKVHASTKVHGTCFVMTLVVEDDELFISSKGVASQGASLKEADNNIYWRTANSYNVKDAAKSIASKLDASRVGIFGEVYGAGIQDLDYGRSKGDPGFAVFDLYIVDRSGREYWLEQAAMRDLLQGLLPTVPTVYEGPYDYELIEKLASGPENITGNSKHVNEGLVVRSVPERYNSVLGSSRTIAKFISPEYLLRKNATEFE